jgi:hypothetical protein
VCKNEANLILADRRKSQGESLPKKKESHTFDERERKSHPTDPMVAIMGCGEKKGSRAFIPPYSPSIEE